MTMYNRIKCSASIGAEGLIVLGAAVNGYRAPLSPMWADGGAVQPYGIPGCYPYLLESGAGEWEIGNVTVLSDAPELSGGLRRNMLESSTGSPFANGTSGLVYSLTANADGMVSASRGNISDATPSAVGTSTAVGANATTNTVADAVAVGNGAIVSSGATKGVALGHAANVSSTRGIAIGDSASASGAGAITVGTSTMADVGAVCIGDQAAAHGIHSVAIGGNVQTAIAGEVALGAQARGRKRFVPFVWTGNNANTGTTFKATDTNDLILGLLDMYASGSRTGGVARLTGTISIQDTADLNAVTKMKVITLDYSVWVDPATGDMTNLGTPTVTASYTGGSAPNSTVTVVAGVPTMATTYAGGLTAYGVLSMDDLYTNP